MYWLRRTHFNYKMLFKRRELEEARGGGGGAHMHEDVDYVCYTPLTCDVSFWHHLLAAAINIGERRGRALIMIASAMSYDAV